MLGSAINSGIRDNHRRGTVADFLKTKIHPHSRLSVVSAYFTIYAYDLLRAHLDQIDHLDFLFGEPRFLASLDPDKTEKKAFILDGIGLKLANRLEQKRVARDCAEWIRQKVDIRSIRHAQLLHGKMYHIANAGVEEAILGSSNFTVRGLGLGAGTNNIELNLEVDGNRDRRDLKVWFDEIWNDPALVEDVKAEVLQYLDQLYQNHAPEFIYFKTLFHVFENFLADQEKGGLLDQNIKIVDTGIWQALFEFQRDGVKGAINKILKHNGCILADSVGLGKTFEALAVIKYFELKNERVLVLCPKKLRENWTTYRHNDALNPFIQDRFRYDVLSHTDLSRDSGKSGDLDLATFNWGNFDLVVIDESHNFRNNTPGKRDEDGNIIRKSRYQRLMDDIVKNGVKTKVLLLSAPSWPPTSSAPHKPKTSCAARKSRAKTRPTAPTAKSEPKSARPSRNSAAPCPKSCPPLKASRSLNPKPRKRSKNQNNEVPTPQNGQLNNSWISSQDSASVRLSSPSRVPLMISRFRFCKVRIFSSTVSRAISL